jgi:succinyl-diaminopimelate desuccinylase
VSLLVTCDEEGPGVNGTAKVLGWLANNDLVPDHCLVGEPTSTDALGDAMKIGRRGSVHFEVTATGTQGHTAYPQLADNPVPKLARLIDRVASANRSMPAPSTSSPPPWRSPASMSPIRPTTSFRRPRGPASTSGSIRCTRGEPAAWVTGTARRWRRNSAAASPWRLHEADCFITEPGPLVEVVSAAVERETKRRPRLTTTGGTSDARFVKNYCPVVEFGPTNATIHKADERIAVGGARGPDPHLPPCARRVFRPVMVMNWLDEASRRCSVRGCC